MLHAGIPTLQKPENLYLPFLPAFYCQSQKLLFSGDTQLRIRTSGGKHTREYVDTLVKLAHKKIELVYPGHDVPFGHNVRSIILDTLQNVRNSEIV